MRPRAFRLSVLLLLLPACTLEPEGTRDEFARLEAAGGAWLEPVAVRPLPPLPDEPAPGDIAARALLANADLEAAWHRWRAALHGVLAASGWPNTNVAVELSSFVEHGSAWDTSAVRLGFDAMDMLLLPSKVRVAGEQAFAEALAAGREFEARRLALRAQVLADWADWALLGERLAAAREDLALVESLERSASAGLAAGGPQATLLARQVEVEQARQRLDTLEAEVVARRAALNALMARAPEAPLALPPTAPRPRARPDLALLLAAGTASNADVARLRAELDAREAAIAVEGTRRTPNLAPSVEAGGGMPERYGLMVSLPGRLPAVQAAIERAQAERDAAGAALRQGELDAGAALAAALAGLLADERAVARLHDEIEPAARADADSARRAYAYGASDLATLVATQRLLLELRVARAEAQASRERRLAEVERLLGTDLERLAAPGAEAALAAAKETP